jgi:acetylxylan esterase
MHISSTVLGGLAALASVVDAAGFMRVNDFGPNPTNLQMNMYVPQKVAQKPAIILAVSPRSAAFW